MNLQQLAALGEQLQVHFTLADIINLFNGQPLNIQVDPLNEVIAGKTLVISLAQNAISIQLR